MTAMRTHSLLTERILGRIAAFGEMSVIAGAHHERLDGKGYPHGIGGSEIALETRVITAADIFDALTAKRPYRDAMPTADAFAIMARDVGTAVDADCFAALRSVVSRQPMIAA
jgi:HD-GYP domain-containing protein (c-di-GMP phosphodiesterase class II)